MKSCVSAPQNNNYAKGRAQEHSVAKLLETKDYKVYISPGSKGSLDLIARKSGKKLGIQVKTTLKPKSGILKNDIDRINETCKDIGAEPCFAIVTKDSEKLLSVSRFFINKHSKTDIIDINGNLVAFRLDTGYSCVIYHLGTNGWMNYDWLQSFPNRA